MKILFIILIIIQSNDALCSAFGGEERYIRKSPVSTLDQRTLDQIEKDCRHPRKLVTALGAANTICSTKSCSIYQLYWCTVTVAKGYDPVSIINEAFVEERKKHRR